MEAEKIIYTKYEVARIIGARALQISMNAPILLNITKEKLEEMNYDPIKIAELEFHSGILPISIKKPMPKREEEEDEEVVEVVMEEEVIPGVVKSEKATVEEMTETEDDEEEIKEEEAIEETE